MMVTRTVFAVTEELAEELVPVEGVPPEDVPPVEGAAEEAAADEVRLEREESVLCDAMEDAEESLDPLLSGADALMEESSWLSASVPDVSPVADVEFVVSA